ncbi:MAG: serine hydrolase domain-containing protein [Bacteroidota bacterium]
MKTKLVGLLVLMMYASVTLPAQNAINYDALRQRADLLLEESVRARDFVGVAAAIMIDGEMVWAGGAGYRDQENQLPADRFMLHRIASVAKPMTAVAILQLEAAGKIELDLPIQTYVPQFPEKPEGTVTIRHLLQHTSGIGAYQSNAEYYSMVEYPTQAAAMAFFQDRPLLFSPGTDYHYTTFGYIVLGAIIEAVSGDSYAAYMREHIWTPAGMTHTDIEHFGEELPQKSKLYGHTNAGTIIEDTYDNLSFKYAGGGIHSTVEDLLLFGQALLDNRLLSAEQFALMQTPPELEQEGFPYAMGCYPYGSEEYGRAIRHGGAQSGTTTFWHTYLDKRIVVAILTNTAGASREIDALRGSLNNLAHFPEIAEQPTRLITLLTDEELNRFVGKFQFDHGPEFEISRQGQHLLFSREDRPSVRMFPYSKTALLMRQYQSRIEFELNENEDYSRLTVYNWEEELTAKRIE